MKTIVLSLAMTLGAVTSAGAADLDAFDANGDRFVTYEELTGYAPGATRSDFNAIDANGDRRLSANEFTGPRVQALVSRFVEDRPAARPAPFSVPRADYAEIDADGDGRITFDELYRVDVPDRSSLQRP